MAEPLSLPHHPPLTSDDSRGRLRRAGWTVRASYSRWVGVWMVYAARGAGTLLARGRSEAEALRHAYELAAAMGMLDGRANTGRRQGGRAAPCRGGASGEGAGPGGAAARPTV